MIFHPTEIAGAFVIDVDPVEDERGLFGRTWCQFEFERQGLNPNLVQCSTSYNRRRGTLRGIHFQRAPHREAKLVRCTRGEAFDVVVDLREASSTFGRHVATRISADSRRMVYVPEGAGHGFQTLEPGTEILYQISTYHAPDFADGVRWNDPDLAIDWPYPDAPVISERDSRLPLLAERFAPPGRANRRSGS